VVNNKKIQFVQEAFRDRLVDKSDSKNGYDQGTPGRYKKG